MNWLRNIRYGVGNLIRFLPIVWRWRPWSFEYSYELMLFGLGRSAISFERHRNHTECMEDVKSITYLLDVWKRFGDAETWEDEERMWTRFHDHLKKDGRRWWD